MMVRTDELLCITEAIGTEIHTRELEAETYGRVRNLVLSPKQYLTHHYCFYEKGTTRAIVGLQGLHLSNAF